ncbi:TIGR03618 family F420-dependent PPOX class oxidoreductase [Actinoplanes sp. HUAS TT8]|uniref:TIGR03618 family F420-dependent PPOX class oxidoreductase n=1 Tax=Actinoplanes sp. HUAS TT8 TaxID=3447453 RepID=UPI003F5249CF
MTTLADAWELSRSDTGLAIVSTARADRTVQSTLVNTGLIDHPGDGGPVLAFVTYGPVKLRNLRDRPDLAIAFRSGWRYATVEGRAELAGPDDPQPWLDPERLRRLLREIFTAAGGTHDDWDAYDRAMVAERRTAVLVRPTRVYP